MIIVEYSIACIGVACIGVGIIDLNEASPCK